MLGGGATKTMYLLLKYLDRRRFHPLVLCHESKKDDLYLKKINNLGIEVISLKYLSNNEQSFLEKRVWRKQNRSILLERLATIKRNNTFLRYLYDELCILYSFSTSDIKRILTVVKIIKKRKIDLLHLYFGFHLRAEIVAARMIGIPNFCHLHTFGDISVFDSMLHRWIDHRVFVSDAVRSHWIKKQPSPKGTIIYNGLEYEEFVAAHDLDGVRNEFAIKKNDFLICNVGRIVEWKGQEVFIQALSRIKEQTPELKAMVIGGVDPGKETYLDRLKQLVEKHRLTEQVIFTGFRKDIPRLLSAADILVHSSNLPEPFGTVIYEAMAAGKPVISTDAGGNPEIIDHDKNGILVKINNPLSMAQAILTCYNNRQWVVDMGEKAREKARRKYTVQRFAKDMQTLYDQFLN